MSPQAQQEAIAEFTGWTRYEHDTILCFESLETARALAAYDRAQNRLTAGLCVLLAVLVWLFWGQL